MKRIFALMVAAALLMSLAACGGSQESAAKSVDLNTIYAGYQEVLPDMFLLDPDTMMNFLGIDPADCTQVVAAISNDGLRTDEVWLIEAKDQAALDRIYELAQVRLVAKEDETISYAPDQYQVVLNAELIKDGLYLALLVSPEVEMMKTAFVDAVS